MLTTSSQPAPGPVPAPASCPVAQACPAAQAGRCTGSCGRPAPTLAPASPAPTLSAPFLPAR